MQTTEELERIRAVSRYLSGESPKAICQSTGRPKKWLYKWVARSKSGDADWFVDDSRAPKHSPSKTAPEISAQIVTARQSLERTPYACRGVFSIRQNLSDDGITHVPSDATINRIINKAGLVTKRTPRPRVGTPYPAPAADEPNDVHQLDLWGPRYLGVGKSCYVLNIVDVARRMPSIYPVPDKSFRWLIPSILRCWQTVGIPRVLQMDNAVATGNSLHPGSICKMLRVCLLAGIQVLFVPFAEPWRQGVVEKFNDFLDKSFFCAHRFQDLAELCEKAQDFQHYCWHGRPLSALRGRTPSQAFPEASVNLLPKDFTVDVDKLAIPPGKISFVRMVRSDCQVDILGLKFPVAENYYREYVTGTLHTESSLLTIHHQGQQIAEFKFSMC
jgi:putative transposase